MQNSTKLIGVLSLALAVPALAQQQVYTPPKTVRSSTARSTRDYSTDVSPERAVAVGFQATAMPDGSAVEQLHGMIEILDRMLVGVGVGFSDDFDTFLLTGDLRYNLVKHGAAGLYVDGQAGFIRSKSYLGDQGTVSSGHSPYGTGNGFMMAALIGVNYALTDSLQLNAGYGLQFAFGDATHTSVGLTNNGPLGNFGVHWYF